MNKYAYYIQPIKTFVKKLNDFQNKTVIFFDTETTGLNGPNIDQLTQIAAIAAHMINREFIMFSSYNKKIKLTPKTLQRMNNETENEWSIKNILQYNHYFEWDKKYISEATAITNFFKWLDKIKGDKEILFVIHNAKFDCDMIEGRSNKKIRFPILDTKYLFQFQLLPLFQTLAENDIKYKTILIKIGTSKYHFDNTLPSSSLSNVAIGLGTLANSAHDALSDCLTLMNTLSVAYKYLIDNAHINIEKYQQIRLLTKKQI